MSVFGQVYQPSACVVTSLRCRAFLLCIIVEFSSFFVFAERLPIKSFTTVDGLPHNAVNKIVRDSRGFIWFCTGDGLSRFDGYEFTHYGVEQGLPHREVSDLLETRNGDYWVATAGGLVQFNPKSPPENRVIYADQKDLRDLPMFSAIGIEGEHPAAANIINVLLEDHDGTVWCGSYNDLYHLEKRPSGPALSRIDIGISDENPEGHIINDLLEDRFGCLWAATPGGLYRRWPDGSHEHYTKDDGLPDQYIHDLLDDHNGQLWVATRYGGFFRLNADESHNVPVVASAFSIHEGLPTPWVFQLFETFDNRFWIATNLGLLEFFPNRDEGGKWFRWYSERNGLSHYDIASVNEDSAGNLWLGTGSTGAMRIERNGFVTYDDRDGLYSVNSIFEDQGGSVCFRGTALSQSNASPSSGENRREMSSSPGQHYAAFGSIKGQNFEWFKPYDLEMGWIMEGVTLRTCTGEWWIGGGRALYRFPPSNFNELATARPLAVYANENGLHLNNLWRLFGDSQGNVWISVQSNHPLVMWRRSTDSFRDLSIEPRFPTQDNLPRSFGEDGFGNVWIGFNGRIARCHNSQFRLFDSKDGIPPGIITSIYTDRAGRVWLTSSRNGLIRIDEPDAEDPSVIVYTTLQGLSSDSTEIMADNLVVEDLLGRIYIGNALGLDRLDPKTGEFRHFTTADGLALGTFKSSMRDSHGGIWFGTTKGLTHFVPASDRTESPPHILITNLNIGGSQRFVSALGEDEISLPDLGVDHSQLQIDFVGLSFTPGVRLSYQYKLEGADPVWNQPTDRRTVNYARLAPGHYRFLVRAVNSDGIVSSTPASISFTVLPHFWLRWWFLLMVAIAITLLLYVLYRYRVAQLVEVERVRTRIATDLHDDIGSSLSRMAILSEVAKRQIEHSEGDSASMLTEIAESARSTVDSMSDIVWAIDPRRDDLSSVVFRVRQFASDVLGAKGIFWQFHAPPDFDRVKLSPQQRRQLFLIFKEAINNAARHANCTSISLSLAVQDQSITGEVRDNGCGFDLTSSGGSTQTIGGYGLENINRRAVQLGGHLTIQSVPNEGTTVKLEVPIKGSMA